MHSTESEYAIHHKLYMFIEIRLSIRIVFRRNVISLVLYYNEMHWNALYSLASRYGRQRDIWRCIDSRELLGPKKAPPILHRTKLIWEISDVHSAIFHFQFLICRGRPSKIYIYGVAAIQV